MIPLLQPSNLLLVPSLEPLRIPRGLESALPRSKRLREPLVEATGLLMVTSPDYSPTQAFVPA